MIPGSRVWKLTAVCTALFAHGALADTFFQGEEVQVEATFPDGTKLVTVHNPIQ